jgi:hypothetical protein
MMGFASTKVPTRRGKIVWGAFFVIWPVREQEIVDGDGWRQGKIAPGNGEQGF